jgi:hypothetical protein
MEKIKGLLAKSGCKPELVDSIVESLESFKTDLEARYISLYESKVKAAKKVCVEETEAHKRELARRLQIFCESKSAAIEAQLTKMSAISESKAVTKLKSVRALLEGVELNRNTDGKTAAAMDKAKRQIKQLTEERNSAIAEANRKTAIAAKALKANRQLVTENAKLAEAKKPIVESHKPARLIAPKKISKPVTARPTLIESQDRKAAPQRQEIIIPRGNVFSINDVAAAMDSDLI